MPCTTLYAKYQVPAEWNKCPGKQTKWKVSVHTRSELTPHPYLGDTEHFCSIVARFFFTARWRHHLVIIKFRSHDDFQIRSVIFHRLAVQEDRCTAEICITQREVMRKKMLQQCYPNFLFSSLCGKFSFIRMMTQLCAISSNTKCSPKVGHRLFLMEPGLPRRA